MQAKEGLLKGCWLFTDTAPRTALSVVSHLRFSFRSVILNCTCIWQNWRCTQNCSLVFVLYLSFFLLLPSSVLDWVFIPFLDLFLFYIHSFSSFSHLLVSLSLSPPSLCVPLSLPLSVPLSLLLSVPLCLCLSACLPVCLSPLSLCFRSKSFLSFFLSLIHVFPSAAPRFACLRYKLFYSSVLSSRFLSPTCSFLTARKIQMKLNEKWTKLIIIALAH